MAATSVFLVAFVVSFAHGADDVANVLVHAGTHVATVSKTLVGAGIEDVNHGRWIPPARRELEWNMDLCASRRQKL